MSHKRRRPKLWHRPRQPEEMMVICNRCKKDPVETETNEALKAAPWGIVIQPPAGSGLPERRYCFRCTVEMLDALGNYANLLAQALTPK